jgi:hypothetical protein
MQLFESSSCSKHDLFRIAVSAAGFLAMMLPEDVVLTTA